MSRRPAGSAIRAERAPRTSGLLVPLLSFIGLGVALITGALLWGWLAAGGDTGAHLSGSTAPPSVAGRPGAAPQRSRPALLGAAPVTEAALAPSAETAPETAMEADRPASAAAADQPLDAAPEPAPSAGGSGGAAAPSVAVTDATVPARSSGAVATGDAPPPGWSLPEGGRLVSGAAGDVEFRSGSGRIPAGAELAPVSVEAASPGDAAGTPGETFVVRSVATTGPTTPLRSALHLVGAGAASSAPTRVEVVVSGPAGCATSFQLVLIQVESPGGSAASWVVALRSSGTVPGCVQRDVVVTGVAPAELVADLPAASIVAPAGSLR